MAKTTWIVKQKKTPKFSTRKYNRCALSGRRRAYIRKFGLSPHRLPASWPCAAKFPV